MTTPDYQTLMLPVLESLGDGKEWPVRELIARVADRVHISEADRTALLPSGRGALYVSRIHWATTYLVKAGLAVRPRRAVVQLTDEGQRVLAASPERIDNTFLERYPSFLEFRTRAEGSRPSVVPTVTVEEDESPEETLERSWRSLRDQLAGDILDHLKACSPRRFEEIVVDLLVKMGYGGTYADAKASVVGKSGDEGIDGIIKEDKLGLDAVYIQAKRWGDRAVQRQDVQAFVGSLTGKRASKGVMITTSTFTSGAQTYGESMRVVLLDGRTLADLMIEHTVGVTRIQSYNLDRIDDDYYAEEFS
jgi:restriction system protein